MTASALLSAFPFALLVGGDLSDLFGSKTFVALCRKPRPVAIVTLG